MAAFHKIELSLMNRRREKLVGTLYSRGNQTSGYNHYGRQKQIAILCHGFLCTRQYYLIRKIGEGIMENTDIVKHVDNVFSFDFPGNGQSEGEFNSLGGYQKELEDLEDVLSYFRQNKFRVLSIIGHSKGATTVCHYASQHDDVDIVISLAARYNMKRGVKERLGDESFAELHSRKGKTIYNDYSSGKANPIEVTINHYNERMSIDNTRVNGNNITKTKKILFMHGTNDTVIPSDDALSFFKQFQNCSRNTDSDEFAVGDTDDVHRHDAKITSYENEDNAEVHLLDGCGHTFAPPNTNKVINIICKTIEKTS